MQFEQKVHKHLDYYLKLLSEGFSDLPEYHEQIDLQQIKDTLTLVATKMRDNFPYHHPLYAGQMLKPPHPVARLAYMLSLWINPNNHALDGGRASSDMEKEAVAQIAAMFGWSKHLGHLCSGGTMANLEALWIANQINPDKKIAASDRAHYTHHRISEVLKIPFIEIESDQKDKMDLNHLEHCLSKENIGTVVVTMGTTGSGAVDQLDDILILREKYGFRIHADAAYGGYFILVDDLPSSAKNAFDKLQYIDSIVIDPHKHGLQPYGAGCVLFADPAVGSYYKHDSPYTYFTSDDLHLGEISLECSRPGSAAVALWATMKLMPLVKEGEFARRLARSHSAAKKFYAKLSDDDRFLTFFRPELDIVIWAPAAESINAISEKTAKLFTSAAEQNLHLAKFNYPVKRLGQNWSQILKDRDHLTCLRSCLMKPEHEDWLDMIWAKLNHAYTKLIKV